jgi:hypothetical protein
MFEIGFIKYLENVHLRYNPEYIPVCADHGYSGYLLVGEHIYDLRH